MEIKLEKLLYNKFLTTIAALLLAISAYTSSVLADDDVYFTLSGGLATVDVGASASQTAQTIADAAGQTVNYEYDQATWALRLAVGIPVNGNISVEGGYFMTGDIDIKYSLPAASVQESYSASGIDIVGKYAIDNGLFFKAGAHRSEVTNKGTISIGGTEYDVGSISASGSGLVIGIGFESDGTIFGFDMYQDIAGFSGNNVSYIYYGMKL